MFLPPSAAAAAGATLLTLLASAPPPSRAPPPHASEAGRLMRLATPPELLDEALNHALMDMTNIEPRQRKMAIALQRRIDEAAW